MKTPQFKTPSFKCLNCNKIIPLERNVKIFCSDLCKQEAKYVRYVRSCKADNRINNTDIQDVLKIRLAHIFSGGYPSKLRRIPKKTREAVIKRDKGLCKVCSKPGNEIDHIKGSSNNMNNLRLICTLCHKKKTMKNMLNIDINDPQYKKEKELYIELEVRINSTKPLNQCDDEKNWINISTNIQLERKKVFSQSVYRFIKVLIKSKTSNIKLAEYLNKYKIPTYTNVDQWNRYSVKNILDISTKQD